MRLMYDSTSAGDLIGGADLYAGYVDGNWPSYSQIAARFGRSRTLAIAVFASTNDGVIGDMESGDMTPSSCVTWATARRRAGVDPTIYCDLDKWNDVKLAFAAASQPQPHFWIAAYPGNGANLYAGAVAHQYADKGPHGENLDMSVVADYWPGVDPAPIPAASVPQEVIMGLPSNCNDGGAVRAQIREWWAQYRTVPLTAGAQNILAYCYTIPNGFNGSPDALLANIIDGGQASGTLRPQWAGAA